MINVKLNLRNGIIYDFIFVISTSLKFDNFEGVYTNLGLELNKNILNSYKSILSSFDRNTIGLKLFFSTTESLSLFSELLVDVLYKAESIDDIVGYLKSYDISLLTYKILSFYDKNSFSEKFYKILLHDKELLMEFLNGLKIPADIKWELLSFISYPESMLNDLCALFSRIFLKIESEYKINNLMLETFYSSINTKFNDNNVSFLYNEDSNFNEIYKKNTFNAITISACMFSAMTIQYIFKDKDLFIYLGFDYEKGLKLVNKSTMNSALLFRAYADKTRVNIVDLVKNEELCATDISERLVVPMSTLSHHLDILCSAGILYRRLEGKKSYFSIQKNAVTTAIHVIKKMYA